MYSKIKIAGHPVHPMLVAFPVTCCTGTLAGFAVYAGERPPVLAELRDRAQRRRHRHSGPRRGRRPGRLGAGIPRDSAAKTTGLLHAGLNVTALGLFLAAVASYVTDWNGPAGGATLGVVLSAIGVAVTIAAGFPGWTLGSRTTTSACTSCPSRNSPSPPSSTTT